MLLAAKFSANCRLDSDVYVLQLLLCPTKEYYRQLLCRRANLALSLASFCKSQQDTNNTDAGPSWLTLGWYIHTYTVMIHIYTVIYTLMCTMI